MNIKNIYAVVAMVPDYQVTAEGDIIILENRYSLVESPFLNLAALAGTLEEDDDNIDHATDTII